MGLEREINMFKVRQPFFKPDGDEGGWLETLSQSNDTPADDEQPLVDSDVESLEDVDKIEEHEDPDPDDVDDADKDDSDDQPLNDDTDVDLGEGRQPVKLSELKQGYLRQSDYTKKTQVLADERQTFETERTQMAPIKQMSDFLGANPYLREQIQTFIQEFTTTGTIPLQEALQDAAYGQYINTLMGQNERLVKENADLKGKYGDLEFGTGMDKAIAELRSEYKGLITPEYEQQLRDQAKTEQLKPDMLKRLAKGDLAEKKLKQNSKSAKDIEAETIQNIQEKRNSLPSQPRSKGQKPHAQTKSIEDIGWGELLQG
jgi:hypothetical protein